MQLSETTPLLTTTSATATATTSTAALVGFLVVFDIGVDQQLDRFQPGGHVGPTRGTLFSRFIITVSVPARTTGSRPIIIALWTSFLRLIATGIISLARSGSRTTTVADGFDFDVILVIVIKGRFTGQGIVSRFYRHIVLL
jgi:hypothetical protein